MNQHLLDLLNASIEENNANRHREEQDNQAYLNLVSYTLELLNKPYSKPRWEFDNGQAFYRF